MWAKLKALPLRVKIIALVVFLALGWLYKRNETHSSYVSRSSYSSAAEPTSRNSSSAESSSQDSAHVLAQLQAQFNQMNAENAQCYAQIQQMNPSNYAAPPCEAQMQWRTAQIAKLQAEIYRLQTGANVQPIDFALMGSGSGTSSGSSGSGGSSDDGSNAVNRYSREAVLGQSLYRDEEGNEYQLANRAYYFRDRASGSIVGSDFGTQPDNQHDWEPLTYEPN